MAFSSSSPRLARKGLKCPVPSNQQLLRKWFNKVTAIYYGAHNDCPCKAFDLTTVKMCALLRDDDPESSWNTSANDEFQKLKSATGVIFENEVESNTVCEESCGSS